MMTNTFAHIEHTRLTNAWAELAKRAGGIIPARVLVTPGPADAHELADDLNVIKSMFSRIVARYGETLESNFSGYDPELTQQAIDLMTDGILQMQSSLEDAAE